MFVLARLSKKRAAELGRGALVKPANNKTYQILLDRSAPLIGASSAFNAGLGGNGSKVCIIDSGFDYYSSELPEPAAARDFTLDDWCMDFPQSAANTRRSFNATLNVSNSSITTLNAAVWWGSASNRYDLRVWKDGSLINATGVSQSPVSNGGYWLFLDLALPSAGDYQIELLETSINASADVPTFLWGGNVSTYGGYYSNPIGCISSPNPVNTGLSKAFYNIHPQDDHGHGTHVAGIMARRGLSNSSLRGVAPNASLYIAKGLSSSGYGFDSEIAQALQWCIDQGTDIISMSLGASASANCDSEIDLLADAAFEAGVLPVIAAGNSGPSSSTISSPACSRGALAVGSTYRMDYAGPVPHSSCSDLDPRADSIACYSSRGPASGGRLKPEISAPGSSINSSYITNATASFDGTSMAAPPRFRGRCDNQANAPVLARAANQGGADK